MQQQTETFTRVVAELYSDRAVPTNFLSSFFRDNEPTNQCAITMDIIRNDEKIAVDVIPGAGALKSTELVPYTNKTYTPPEYNEKTLLTAESMLKRLAGHSAYSPMDFAAATAAGIATGQQLQQDKILRAIEVQSRDALVYGNVTLINSESLDFKRKPTHEINATVDWSNPASDIQGDIAKAGDVIRQDGKVTANTLIFGKDAIKYFMTNLELQKVFNFRRADSVLIKPTRINMAGAKFIGTITVENYDYEMWTYPQFYTVPLGYAMPNEGESVPYIPDDKVVVMDKDARFDRFWGAIPRYTNGNAEGVQAAGYGSVIPVGSPVRYAPYFLMDEEGTAFTVGVKSRPVSVLTAVDTVAVITITTA